MVKKSIRFFLIFLFLFLFKINAFAIDEIQECFNYINAQDYNRAISVGQKAVNLYPASHLAYFCLGEAYYLTGEISNAIETLKKAEQYSSSDSDLIHVYNLLGLIYHNKGELDKALSHYEQSLNLKTNEKDKIPAYNNIANIYSDKGDFKKAIEYLQKAMDIAEKYDDYQSFAQVEINLGNTYRKMKDFDNAQNYLFDGLKRIQKIGDTFWEGIAYKCIGFMYMDQGNKTPAEQYLNKALEIFKSIGAQKELEEVSRSITWLKSQSK